MGTVAIYLDEKTSVVVKRLKANGISFSALMSQLLHDWLEKSNRKELK